MYWHEYLSKFCKKCPLQVKYVLALPREIWGDRFHRQRRTYMYILMNHRIATHMTNSRCLKNRHTCSKLHYLYTTCSKCPPPARTKISESDVDELRRRIKYEWIMWITLFIERVSDVAPASTCLPSCWRQTFRAYDVKMMWLYMSDDSWDNDYQSFCSYSMIHQNVSTALTSSSSLLSLQISQGSASTYYRWSEHFLHIGQYMPTILYWNRFTLTNREQK